MRIRYHTGYDIDGKWQCVEEGKLKIRLWPTPESAKMARESGQTAPIPQANDSHSVIPDDMEPTVHPCDGKTYTSKARFREVTRQHDKIEIGNEREAFLNLKPEDKRPPMSESIKKATEMLHAIDGKSDGERREIQKRFYGEAYESLAHELEIEAACRGRNGECMELKDRLLEKYGGR